MPLEIHIQGFEIVSLEARMAAMTRPAYRCMHDPVRVLNNIV